MRGSVRPPVGEALALGAAEQLGGALAVVKAELFAVVVTEIGFREIAVQVRLGDLEVVAVDAALEERKRSSPRCSW